MYRCFDEFDDAVAILDRDNTVVRLNRSFQETFGIGNDAARGMEIGDLIARHLAPLFEEGNSAGRLIDAFRNREEVAHGGAYRMRTSSGEVCRFSLSCRAISGEPCAGERLVRFRENTPGRKEERARIRPSRSLPPSGGNWCPTASGYAGRTATCSISPPRSSNWWEGRSRVPALRMAGVHPAQGCCGSALRLETVPRYGMPVGSRVKDSGSDGGECHIILSRGGAPVRDRDGRSSSGSGSTSTSPRENRPSSSPPSGRRSRQPSRTSASSLLQGPNLPN
ncbi:PAS domain S-box protein [Methanoculleus chikugoensis]|uniref:PAS domain-containing protein n=1 Tax=Methanoculleus chikugoensis TaxID=118126 RepID=UPI0006D25890|nr:PAS domain-containing protein [Methanoculleus chikugoensis]